MNQQSVYTLLYFGTQHSEQNGEFSLPDYLPDVRRVLRVTAAPRVTGKFMNGERLELEGEVGMTLLYLSEENTVCAFSAALPYAQSIAVAGLDETAVITAKLQTDSAACRLTGPRKCVFRARCALTVRAAAAQPTAPDTTALTNSEQAALCTYTEPYTASALTCLSKPDLRYAEDLPLDDGVIQTVLSCEVTPIVKECRVSSGHIVCRGEFDITAFCAVGDGTQVRCQTLHHRAPFTETFEADAVTDDGVCEPDITVTAVSPTVTEEGRNLGVDFVCDAAVICASEHTIPVITDVFLPHRDIALQKRQFTLYRPLKTVSGAFSAAAVLKTDPQDAVTAVADIRMRARCEHTECRDGRIHIEGTLDISLIVSCADGKYMPVTGTVPLQWDTDAAPLKDPDSLLCLCDLYVTGFTARPDTAGSIACDAEIAVFLSAAARTPCQLPHAIVSVGENAQTAPPPTEPLVLCYPEKGERVWDIAKHYRIPPELLCRINHLDEHADSALIPGQPLLIPIHPQLAQMIS
ncbi:MAG: DUF3794 domain-containing protein [Clostridia bacterium]|nr:DUF3794 domain-containing protein [Clostridia bacterium]